MMENRNDLVPTICFTNRESKYFNPIDDEPNSEATSVHCGYIYRHKRSCGTICYCKYCNYICPDQDHQDTSYDGSYCNGEKVMVLYSVPTGSVTLPLPPPQPPPSSIIILRQNGEQFGVIIE